VNESTKDQQAKQRFDAAIEFASQGRHDDAAHAYREVLQLIPDLVPALFNLGNSHLALKQFEDAVLVFQRVVALDADADAYNNLGNALASTGQFEEAAEAFQQALTLAPSFTPALNNLGPALIRLGRVDEALTWLIRSVEASPANPRPHLNLADGFFQVGRIADAAGCYEISLELDPQQTDAWINLGLCQSALGQLSAAAGSYVRAQQISPNDARVYNNLGELNRRRGQVSEAQFCYLRALQLAPGLHETHSNWLLTMVYDQQVNAPQLLKEAKNWARQHASGLPRLPAPTANNLSKKRLRIGYLSPDFRQHPVGYLIEPILRVHDRANVEVFCYANQEQGDRMTDVLRDLADHWRFVQTESDEALANLIRDDQIDILVELSGHTADHRLRMMARKPAPIQASWLGFWSTTGVPEIDYVIADDTVIPKSEQSFYTETVFRLPNSYACFGEPREAPAASPLPATSTGAITFGCLNNIAKMTPAVVRRWSSVMQAVSGSKLFLKSPAFADAEVCNRIRGAFGENFINPTRLRLESGGSRSEMLEAYGDIDIALDPFPFNGGITTLEALWMGVPVLTLRGDRFASHASESFLRTLGLDEWVAESNEDHTAKAVAQAGNLNQLSKTRAALRDRMIASPLCNHQLFAQHLEAAYREMWERWCAR